MEGIKVWPHMTIMAIVVALISGLGVALWLRNEKSVSAEDLPYAARIQRVEGQVAFSENLASEEPNAEWVAATPNQPFSVGDRIYTRDNGRTSLAFTGRNFARLEPNTSLDVVALDHRRTQLALREGSAIFDVGYLQDDELFEVATPYGAVNFEEPGLYNVGFDDNGGVLVSVLSGLAQVAGLGGSGEINKGEVLTLLGQTAAELVLSRINNDNAGYMVDDYYRYQYPNSYDGRYSSYDAYQNDPYYYDPYRRNASYQYASSYMPGLHELDYYGDWQNVDGYGYAWSPRVDSGWAPYQSGQWTNDYPYGPTWISSEPWGYAPYHYGRWANVGNQWYWIPEGVNTTPSYAPALVAFIPVDQNQIGWVPLGPGDVYAPRYYDENWQPQYLTRAELSPSQLINLGIPGAVTVVPLDAFGRVVDPRSVRRIDRERLASFQPTLDPLTLTPLRNAVIHSAWGRGKIDLPPGIAKKLNETPVYFGREVRDSRFSRNVKKSLRAERVSDNARGQKFKVRDAREDRGRQQAGEQAERARQQEIDRLNAEAVKGNREAERQARQLEQQQRNQAREQARDQAKANREQEQRTGAQQQAARAEQENQEKARSKAQQQPQGQRVGNSAKPQPKPRPERPKKQAAPKQRPEPQVQQRPQAQPRPQAQQAQQVQPRPQAQQAQQAQPRPQAQRAESPQREAPAHPAGHGNASDGGKGKGKGKP